MQQATLKAVGWERRHGERQQGREPLDLALGWLPWPRGRALWPLAQGAVEAGARFTQAELHLHGKGCCPPYHDPTCPSRWKGSPRTRPWLARRTRDVAFGVLTSVAKVIRKSV